MSKDPLITHHHGQSISYRACPEKQQIPFIRQKTIVAAVSVAICASMTAYAGSHPFDNATTPVIVAGDGGQDNILTVTNSTVGTAGTPHDGIGGWSWPALVSIGGNNGTLAPPSSSYDFHDITINLGNTNLFGRNNHVTGLEGVYGKTDTANSAVKFNIENSQIDIGSTGQYSNAILAENFGTNGTVDVKIVNSDLKNTYTGAAPAASSAIVAAGDGDASVTIDRDSSVTSSGLNASAVHASSGSGNVKVDNSGAIFASGVNAHGIVASGAGQITIDNFGALKTTGDDSKGIGVTVTGSGDLTINHHAGASIETSGDNSSTLGYHIDHGSAGIFAQKEAGATGNILVTIDGSITTHGINRAGGAFVHNAGSGDATIRATGNITTTNAAGPYSYGLSASIGPVSSSGNASIYYTNAAGYISTQANDSGGLYAYVDTGHIGNSNTRIENAGTITTAGDGSSYGLWARVLAGTGSATIINSGAVTTSGSQLGSYTPSGIRAETVSGNIDVFNGGEIRTSGYGATGIHATTVSGDSQVISSGKITVADARGIVAWNASGNATITANNDVTTGRATATNHNHGIEAGTLANGKATVNYDKGTVKVVGTAAGGNSIGVVAWDRGSDVAGVDGQISLGSNAIVDATQGVGGVQMRISGNAQLSIAQGAQVHGGANNGYGVNLSGKGATASHTVNNAGLIDSMNDRAMLISVAGGDVQIDNHGTIAGFIQTASGSNVTFRNWSPNSLDIRNFADTNGDGVRDTKAVSVSTFGGVGSTFVNQVNGVVRLLPVNGETAVNTTGQWLHDAQAQHDISNPGINQGQLLELGRFENYGTIDLTSNGQPGDTLIISGGVAPGKRGADAPGVYVSEGGSLRVDTVLNRGDEESQTDLLSVDSVILGSAPTVVYVNKVGGKGAYTPGNGIEIVDVRNGSDAGAFVLGRRVVAGPYEYMLYQGDRNYSAQSWFLRTNDSNGVPIYRAEVGSYLANQTAATGLFMHTLHDRLGEPQFTDTYKSEGKVPSGWVRIVGNHTDSRAAGGVLDQDTDSYLVHFGGELAAWSNSGNDRWHLGLMGAYGESKTDTSVTYHTPQSITRTSKGKVNGYAVGAYATWYQNQDMPRGLYLDSWLQYGWFDNKVTGKGEPTQSYNSDVFTASLEAGYAFIAHDGDKRQWMIEPQAQVAYNSYSADDVTDNYGMRVSGRDASGVVTRLGARMYSRSKLGDNSIQPFVETNWWYGSADNSLDFEGTRVKDGTPESRFEVKVGAQGEIARGWQMWGHISGMWGNNSYDRYEGMVGLKKLF